MGLTEPGTVPPSLLRKRALRKALCPPLHAVLACAPLLLCLVPASAPAHEQSAGLRANRNSLPQALLAKTTATEELGSVAGTVLDLSGATVPGADVSLMYRDGTHLHTMISGASGEFNFINILPGSYVVI